MNLRKCSGAAWGCHPHDNVNVVVLPPEKWAPDGSAKRSCRDVRAETATRRICFMVSKDAINVVDAEGFCELMNYDEPGYRIVSAGTITIRAMKRHEKKKKTS